MLQAWHGLRATMPDFGPIKSDRAFARMNVFMEALLEEVGDDEDHELADLLDVVSSLVLQYDNLHNPDIPPAEPKDVLKLLMEQHELKQVDLARELGSQGVVSDILTGRRELNARQIRVLAKRFKVSPVVFLGS